jgi:hypothetical protein
MQTTGAKQSNRRTERRRRDRLIRLVLAVCAIHLAAPRRAAADWTFTAFLGTCRTRDTWLRVSQPSRTTEVTLSPVRYDSASFDAPPYYGYRVGAFPGTRWFGVEGEFIHLKVFADTARPTRVLGVLGGQAIDDTRPLATIVQRFSISHGVNLLLVNGVVRHRSTTSGSAPPRWIVAGRFGAGASIPHPESTIDGASLERYEWGAFAIQVAAGVEVHVARRIYAFGEYKLTRTVQDVRLAEGSARTSLITQHLVFGVVAHIRGADER